jgi:hypothetical protein
VPARELTLCVGFDFCGNELVDPKGLGNRPRYKVVGGGDHGTPKTLVLVTLNQRSGGVVNGRENNPGEKVCTPGLELMPRVLTQGPKLKG